MDEILKKDIKEIKGMCAANNTNTMVIGFIVFISLLIQALLMLYIMSN